MGAEIRSAAALCACLLAWTVPGGWFAPAGVRAQEAATGELVPLVLELLTSDDRDLRALAFEQVRSEAPGEQATRTFAAQLPQLPAEAQVGLLQALGDRGDAAARDAVLERMTSADESVRVAAIQALGSLGQPGDLPRLVQVLAGNSPSERQAARESLVRLPGDVVPGSIAALLASPASPARVALIEILVERRALEALPQLLAAAVDADSQVRMAAMRALGELAGPEQLAGMLQGVLKAQPGAEREAAEKAVMFACARIDDPARRGEALLAAMRPLGAADKRQLLPTLGRIGGSAALTVVQRSIVSKDSAEHAAGIRALANWPDASVAPQLIELANHDAHAPHRTTALRALVRIAPLPDDRTDQQRLDLLQRAMRMCAEDRERQLVIRRARAVRIPQTLRFVVPYLDEPSLAEVACETIVELAHHRTLRQPNKPEFDRALDRVMETSRDATIRERAQRYKNNQTWVRPG